MDCPFSLFISNTNCHFNISAPHAAYHARRGAFAAADLALCKARLIRAVCCMAKSAGQPAVALCAAVGAASTELRHHNALALPAAYVRYLSLAVVDPRNDGVADGLLGVLGRPEDIPARYVHRVCVMIEVI